MLRNNNTILSNENKIFKSQAVDSYLSSVESYYMQWNMTLSGVTENNPFKYYVQQPNSLVKKIYTSDITDQTQLISPTSESSEKPIYVFGNLESVIQIDYKDGDYNKRGDLLGFISQFPNLESFEIQSQFQYSISYASFPKNLKIFYITDQYITGDVNTFQNWDNLETLGLQQCDFTGDISILPSSNLTELILGSNTFLDGDIENIFNNYPLLNYLYITGVPIISGNIENINVSGLTYIYLSLYQNDNIYGDITHWTFHDDLTTIYLYLNENSPSGITADITNWDFSNTKCTAITIQGHSSYSENITGNISNWVLPDTLTSIRYTYTDITTIPSDLSNTSLNSIYVQICDELVSISGTTFPDTIRTIYFNNCDSLIDNINDWSFNTGTTSLSGRYCALVGDINDYTIPENVSSLDFQYSDGITGYLSGITFNDKIITLYLHGTSITGGFSNWTIPPTLRTMYLYNTNLYLDFDDGLFYTSGLTNLRINSISGVTGDLSNFIIDDSLDYLYMYNSNVDCDLSNLVINLNLRYLIIYGNPNIYGDLTDWISSGDTSLNQIQLYGNYNISGDTSNWNINNTSITYLPNTSLSGRLKHNNVYQLYINDTNISSNIVEDFNFSNRCIYFKSYDSAIWGNLSGVTLYTGFYNFFVQNNSGITGSDDFIDYIFINKKNFTYTSPSINISNIGDTVTGTEQLGDLGTYGGNENDLTEEQVNNLVDGTDYDGLGTNTPWTQAEKIYWMKNATVSSTNPAKRYVIFQFTY
jgi:hypothetical protein